MDQFAPFWQEYGKKNNTTIEVDKTGDFAQQKLTTMFASDSGPDLFDSEFQSLPRMYDSGSRARPRSLPLAGQAGPGEGLGGAGNRALAPEDLRPPLLDGALRGLLQQVPLQAEGITDPWDKAQNRGDWTMEEMVEAARKINEPANDVWGLDWGPQSAYNMGPLLWSAGVSHFQYDPNIEWTLGLPEVTQAFNTAIDWLMKMKIDVASPDAEATASRDRLQGGKPGIGAEGDQSLLHGQDRNPLPLGERLAPDVAHHRHVIRVGHAPRAGGAGQPGASWAAGHPVCAYSKTKQPDASWEFMRWLAGDEFQGVLAENQFLVPAKEKFQERFFRPRTSTSTSTHQYSPTSSSAPTGSSGPTTTPLATSPPSTPRRRRW